MSARYAFVPATQEHAEQIAPRLWLRDANGIRERFGLTPHDVAREAIERSLLTWAAVIDGQVICLFGLRADSILGDVATPWVLPSLDVKRMHKTFWRGSREAIAMMLDRFPRLEGYCDADFHRSREWLRRLGAKFKGPFVAANTGGICYLTFQIRKA